MKKRSSDCELFWIPLEFGGYKNPPRVGSRPRLLSQEYYLDDFGNVDVTLTHIGALAGRVCKATIEFMLEPNPKVASKGQLFFLLSGARAIAIGKFV